jgi:hypothetical protein
MTEAQSPPGWYPDPAGSGQQRYFDGTTWTENYAPGAPPAATAAGKKGHGCLYAVLGAVAVIGLLIVFGIVALGGAAKKVSDDITKTNQQVAKEVKLTGCATDTIGFVEAAGTVHNTSSGRSDYLIDVAVNDSSGTQLDSGSAIVNNVEPGQTAKWTAMTTAKPTGSVTCKVVAASRHASITP